MHEKRGKYEQLLKGDKSKLQDALQQINKVPKSFYSSFPSVLTILHRIYIERFLIMEGKSFELACKRS